MGKGRTDVLFEQRAAGRRRGMHAFIGEKGKLSGLRDRQDDGNERNRRHRLRLRVNEGHNWHSNKGIWLLHAAILFYRYQYAYCLPAERRTKGVGYK